MAWGCYFLEDDGFSWQEKNPVFSDVFPFKKPKSSFSVYLMSKWENIMIQTLSSCGQGPETDLDQMKYTTEYHMNYS